MYGMFLNTNFVGSINKKKIDIYIFIHVSGCVDIGISAPLCPGAYSVVMTALVRGTFLFM